MERAVVTGEAVRDRRDVFLTGRERQNPDRIAHPMARKS